MFLLSPMQCDIKHSSASGPQNNLSCTSYIAQKLPHLPRIDSSHQGPSDAELNLDLLHVYECQAADCHRK